MKTLFLIVTLLAVNVAIFAVVYLLANTGAVGTASLFVASIALWVWAISAWRSDEKDEWAARRWETEVDRWIEEQRFLQQGERHELLH